MMDICSVYMFSLRIMLLWTSMYKFLCGCVFHFSLVCVSFQEWNPWAIGDMIRFLRSWLTVFHIGWIIFHSHGNFWGLQFPSILPSLFHGVSLWLSVSWGYVNLYPFMVLIYVSLIINNVEHFCVFIGILMYSLEKYPCNILSMLRRILSFQIGCLAFYRVVAVLFIL